MVNVFICRAQLITFSLCEAGGCLSLFGMEVGVWWVILGAREGDNPEILNSYLNKNPINRNFNSSEN